MSSSMFGETTGLITNIQKSSVTPISCNNIDLDSLLADLPMTRSTFPIKYLGLPLSINRLKKIEFLPLIEKLLGRMKGWYGRHLTQTGRACLTKTVLSSQPVYLLTVIKMSEELLEDFDRLRKRFLWAGDAALTGGKCKVNWIRTNLPKQNGGLGILNMERFARALRLRWLWHEWASPHKAWVGTQTPCDDIDRLLFAACTQITIGNGKRASFWNSGWLQGCRPKDLAPNLFSISRSKKRTVAQALTGSAWITDIRLTDGLTTTHLLEYVKLWELLRNVQLHPNQEDEIRWKLTPTGTYTAASAYKAQFVGCTRAPLVGGI